jgi:hypothetical protein
MSPISGPSGYVLVPTRVGADFILWRGRQNNNPSSILAVAPATEQLLMELPWLDALRALLSELVLPIRLKTELSSELHDPGAHCSGNASKSRTRESAIRVYEIWSVQSIEYFPANFKPRSNYLVTVPSLVLSPPLPT